MRCFLLALACCLATIGPARGDETAGAQALKRLGEVAAAKHKQLEAAAETAEEGGDFAEALQIHKQMLALREEAQGSGHWETVSERWTVDRLQKILAANETQRGQWRKAIAGLKAGDQLAKKGLFGDEEPHKRAFLKACLEVLGEKHPTTARAYSTLGLNLELQRKFPEANPMFKKALEINLELLGETHASTGVGYANLGANIRKLGQPAQALKMVRKAKKVILATLGEESDLAASCYAQHALCMESQSQLGEAQKLARKALEIRKRFNGDRSAATAQAYDHLARLLSSSGQYEEAEQLSRKALAIQIEVVGETHPSTLNSYNSLAACLFHQSKYGDAETIFRKTVKVQLQLLGGKADSTTAYLYNNLGVVLNQQGKYSEAQKVYEKALAIRLKLFGEDHSDTVMSLLTLAQSLDSQLKYVEAEALHRKTLKIATKVLGPKHAYTAMTIHYLADNLKDQQRYDEAEPLFAQATGLMTELYGDAHPQVARAYNNYAGALSGQGKTAEAEAFYRKALAIWLARHGETHSDVAAAYNNLASVLASLGKFEESETYTRKALAIWRRSLGEQHQHVAVARRFLAVRLMAQQKYDEAIQELEQGARVYETARLRVANEEFDRGVFGWAQSPYELLSALKARQGRHNEAWLAAELNHGRALIDLVTSRRGATLTEEEVTRQRGLRERLAKLRPAMASLASQAEPGEREKTRLAQLREEKQTIESDLAAIAVAASQREIATLEEVQNALPARTALVFWIDEGNGTGEHWGCVLRKQGEARWVRLPGTGPNGEFASDDERLPLVMMDALTNADGNADLDGAIAALRRQRIEPLRPFLQDIDSLYVIAVSEMSGVPIEVLTDDYTVSYVPSGTYLARAAKRPPSANTRLLALGDPVFKNQDAKAAAEEDKALPPGGVLLSTVVAGGSAAKARLRSGDVLLSYGGQKLNSVSDLAAAMEAGKAEGAVQVKVWRSGETMIREVSTGRLGIALAKEPAREAIASRRKTAGILVALRDGHWDELPGTRAEVNAIAKLFGDNADVLIDSAASEQQLEQLRQDKQLEGYRILHLATHGAADTRRALESKLILANDRIPSSPEIRQDAPLIDGQLTALEVLRHWKLDADLVTLSACETALGRSGGGDGPLGFAQGFLSAGSRSVVLSLWKVDDTATALLMQRFYQNLLGGRPGISKPMSKAAALSEAKAWLRNLSSEAALRLSAAATDGVVRGERGKGVRLKLAVPGLAARNTQGVKPFAHPRYWSAFILIGDPE